MKFLDYQKHNPLRPLSWRYDRVRHLCERGERAYRNRDDDYVRQGKVFLGAWDRLSEQDRLVLFPDYPGLYYAYDIYESDDEHLRLMIEARLLAGQTDAEIAALACTTPEAIDWYEKMFYNVRDRLTSRDWVQKTAIMPAFNRREDDNGYEFGTKLMSYTGGPLIADEILAMADLSDRPMNKKQVDGFWDRFVMRAIKRRSAQCAIYFDINKYSIRMLMEQYIASRQLEHQLEQTDTNKTDLESTVMAFMSEVKFIPGIRAMKDTSPGSEFNNTAVELRPEEMARMAMGETLPNAEKLLNLRLPPPREKKDGEPS